MNLTGVILLPHQLYTDIYIKVSDHKHCPTKVATRWYRCLAALEEVR